MTLPGLTVGPVGFQCHPCACGGRVRALRYADQNERDLEDFIKAIRSGRLEAVEGV